MRGQDQHESPDNGIQERDKMCACDATFQKRAKFVTGKIARIGTFIEGKRIGHSPTLSVIGDWNDHLSRSCVMQRSYELRMKLWRHNCDRFAA